MAMLSVETDMIIAIKILEIIKSCANHRASREDLALIFPSSMEDDFYKVSLKLRSADIIKYDPTFDAYVIPRKRHVTAMNIAKALDYKQTYIKWQSKACAELEMRLEAAFLATRII